jgi:hypothetical protein
MTTAVNPAQPGTFFGGEMSVDHLLVTVVESPPFAPLPEPRHLYVVPPSPVAYQEELPLPLRVRPAAIEAIAPMRSRILVHADPASDRLRGAPLDPDDAVDPHFGRRMSGRADLPDPLQWCARFSQAALEIIAGRRTPTQMMRWTNRSVYAQLVYRSGAVKGRVVIKRIRICEPVDGIAEASVVALFNERAHALALRFEGLDGRWLCTALTAQI